MLPKNLAFVDIETTGGSLNHDRIIEVAILRVEGKKLVKKYQSLINPNVYIPQEIITLTGITQGEVENAPTFRQIKDEILEILNDSILVAHNARFDYSFLKNEFKRLNISFSPKHLCTVKLSRLLYPQFRHHNLDSLMERFGFICKSRHRAFDDADVLFKFYKQLLKEFETNRLILAIDKVIKKPSIPVNLSAEIINNLPESPGVYIFYGAEGMPLYIGKSVNIKDRVMSHFSSDYNSSLEMKISQAITSIETIQTSGELGALLKESQLIKQMQPLYNRMLRYSRKMVLLKIKNNPNSYDQVIMEEVDCILQTDLDNMIGVFKNKRSAKQYLIDLAKTHNLCEKLLGLEHTSSGCFGYKLGVCYGACVGKEGYLKYNLRFLGAVLKDKIKPWPFLGPIVIEEKDNILQKGESYLMDKWMFLGIIQYEEGAEKVDLVQDIKFDLDIYKILSRYLTSLKNIKNIRSLDMSNLSNSINSDISFSL